MSYAQRDASLLLRGLIYRAAGQVEADLRPHDYLPVALVKLDHQVRAFFCQQRPAAPSLLTSIINRMWVGQASIARAMA